MCQRSAAPAQRLAQEPRGLLALAVVGVAGVEVALRHAVEGCEDGLRLEVEPGEVRADRGGHGVDIDGIVVVGRRHPHGRLPAQPHERAEGLVAGRRRGGRGVLRIERHQQQAVAAPLLQRLDARGGGGVGVAHRPVDDDPLVAEPGRELLCLRARDGLERALVELRVPDLGVVLALAAGADGQDDQVEDRPPLPARQLDHALVGEELLEIAPHRPVAGGVGRAEVEQEDADAAALDRRMAGRPMTLVGLSVGALHRRRSPSLDGRRLHR